MNNKFLTKLNEHVLVGDGAMGTLLYERGVPQGFCHEELNLTKPELVRQIHADYIAAGAQVIRTNTFGANPWKLSVHGLEDKLGIINRTAVELARKVANGKDVFVAASIGPLTAPDRETQPTPEEREAVQRAQIVALLEAEPDILFFETYTDLDDLLRGVLLAKQLDHERPVIASMSFSEDGFTFGGVNVVTAFQQLRAAGADVVGSNCLNGPHGTLQVFRRVPLDDAPQGVDAGAPLLSAYPNAGRPQFFNRQFIFQTTPEYMGTAARQLVEEGVRLVGSCCGTNPSHTAAIAAAVRGLRPVTTKVVVPITQQVLVAKPVQPPSETILDIIKKRTLIVTELDPPRNMDYAKILKGAAELKAAGTDALTVADNSMAVLRMSNVALAHLVEREVGLITLVHLACRDRNSIGLQSELMGMAALGLRHVLAVTGDPARFGDTPDATSVYDLNSVELIGAIGKLNGGQTLAGRPLKYRTNFVAGCAFDPNAANIEGQAKRLERKIAAGAQFVMTQPIYDRRLAKAIYDVTRRFGVPVLVGVMPLLNARNTEFLANEVPGITIPHPVRERMRGKEGEEGRKEGLAVAREMAESVLEHFPGIYLITPLARYDLTVELSKWVREQKKR
jgi:homocysteine S-methyltransferase